MDASCQTTRSPIKVPNIKTGIVTGRVWTPDVHLKALVVLPVLFLLPTFVIPLGIVIYRGMSGTDVLFGQYTAILGNTTFLHVLYQTFQTALIATLLTLLLGFPIAHTISRARPFWANIAFALVMVPLWTSVVTRTYAWVVLLSRRGFINETLIGHGWIEAPVSLMYNGFAVQVGMVQVLLPMMVLPLLSTMRQIDRTKLLAAEVLGANPIRAFIHVYVPLCLPGIMAGSILVFITALGFYITPALLGGDRSMMISVLIEQQVTQTLNWPLASALATILLLTVVLSLGLVALAARQFGIRMADQ